MANEGSSDNYVAAPLEPDTPSQLFLVIFMELLPKPISDVLLV